MSITMEEAVRTIRDEADAMESSTVYFEMKKWGATHILTKTVGLMKICIVANRHGLPITANLISVLMGKHNKTATSSLHQLGDKDLMKLSDMSIGKGQLVWNCNPDFLKQLEGRI